MDRETQVVAIELAHGEDWTFFEESDIYAISTHLDLCSLQRAVAEMTVHARMRRPIPAIPVQAVPV